MTPRSIIGALAFAMALSVNIDGVASTQPEQYQGSQYSNDQSWAAEQDRRAEERQRASDQYRDASRKQKRCFSDACRTMYGDQMNRATEEIYKNN